MYTFATHRDPPPPAPPPPLPPPPPPNPPPAAPRRLRHWRLQPPLQQPQHLPVTDPARQRLHQLRVRNRVEVARHVSVDHLGMPRLPRPVHLLNRLQRRPPRSIAIGRGLQIRFEYRLQDQQGRGLHHPVPNDRDPQWPLPASRLRNQHPPHRLRS